MALVVDTSALAAIYKAEPGYQSLVAALARTELAILPASCLVEACLLRRLGEEFLPWVENYIAEAPVELAPVSLEAAKLAAAAARTYGKGSGHPAQLNFGDCLSYGVARELPLLYVGNDFHHTDIAPAL
jgi:ribonuclease VapC